MKDRAEYFEEVIKPRIQNQIMWYERKAQLYRKLYSWTTILLSIFLTFLPVGIFFLPSNWKAVNIVVSLLVVCIFNISRIMQYENRWMNYRSTAELLRNETRMFDEHVGNYSEAENPEKEYIDKIYSIVTRENTLWLAEMSIRKDQGRNAG